MQSALAIYEERNLTESDAVLVDKVTAIRQVLVWLQGAHKALLFLCEPHDAAGRSAVHRAQTNSWAHKRTESLGALWQRVLCT